MHLAIVNFIAPDVFERLRFLTSRNLVLPAFMAVMAFVMLAYAPSNTGTPLDELAPEGVAACGFATFNAIVDDANDSNTDYSDSAADAGYANGPVRVFITTVSGTSGQQWCNLYKFNAFSETSTSASAWEYMGSSSAASSTCDYVANSRTNRGYHFRGTGGNCATNVWAMHYTVPTYGQGDNGGWVRELSCTAHATPYADWSTSGAAQKPHAGTCGTTTGFRPTGMGTGTGTSGAIFIDTVAPTAPTWTVAANANVHKSSNTLYFRKVTNTFSITLTHTEVASSTASGSKSYSWGAMSSTTGWSGYTSGTVTTTGTSAKSFTSSTTSANATLAVDSNDRAGNDGTNLTITFTADAAGPVVNFTAPDEGTRVFTTDTTPTYTWTESDALSGIETQSGQFQQAVITSPGTCSTTWSTLATVSNPTTTYTPTAQATGFCYRFVLTTADQVSNSTTSVSGSYLLDTTAPSAPVLTDNSGSLTTAHRVGNNIYINPAAAGTVAVTSDSTDNESDVKEHEIVIDGGGLLYAGDPVTVDVDWIAAQSASIPVVASARNNTNLASSTSSVTLVPDSTAPTVTHTTPAAFTMQSANSYTFAWAGSDAASGVLDYHRVLQSAPITAAGTCSSTWTNVVDLLRSATASYNATGFTTATCYRMAVRGYDNVGNVPATFTFSPAVLVDTTAPTAPVITDNTASVSVAYRTGSTIYFNSSTGSSFDLISTGTDSQSGISGSAFGVLSSGSGWTYTSGTVAGNPASKTLSWAAGAASTTIGISATNNAGLTGSATTLTLTGDNAGPVATFTSPAAGFSAYEDISYTVIWSETDGVGSGTLSRSLQRQRTLPVAGSCDGVSGWENRGTPVTTASPSVQTVVSGYCYRWVQTLTDRVGNVTASTSGIVLVDTADFEVDLTYDHSNGHMASPFAAGTLTITASFNKEPSGAPTISINQTGSADVTDAAMTVDVVDATIWTYAWTIAANNGTTDIDGPVAVDIEATDAFSNPLNTITGGAIATDTVAPAAPTSLTLASASDSGSSNTDGITNINQPLLVGTAEADVAIEISTNSVVVATGDADGSGNFAIVPGTPLADSPYTLTAVAIDAAGNASSASSGLAITIDTVAPAVSTPTLDSASDSGQANDDGITNDNTPQFNGTAEANADINLNVQLVGAPNDYESLILDATPYSHWRLGETTGTTATDISGNSRNGTYSGTYALEASGLLAADEDTAVGFDSTGGEIAFSSNLGLTQHSVALWYRRDGLAGGASTGYHQMAIRLMGSNGNLYVHDQGYVLYQGIDDTDGSTHNYFAGGSSSYRPFATDGSMHFIVATYDGTTMRLYIDGEEQGSGSSVALRSGGSAVSTTIGRIGSYQPNGVMDEVSLFSRALSATEIADLYQMGALAASGQGDSGVADGSGDWTIISSVLADEEYQVSATARDLAGNAATSDTTLLTIDTQAPTAPGQAVLATASDTGSSDSDGLTNDTTPTFTGSGQSGSLIRLYENTTSLGSNEAAASAWTITTSTLTQGSHAIFARASDVAGNESIDSAATAINIDTTAPTSALSALGERQSALLFPISYNASDSASPIWNVRLYFTSISGTPMGSYTQFGPGFSSSPISFTAPTDGRYYFYSRAVDAAGNVEAAPANYDTTTFVRSRDRSASSVIWTFADNDTHWDVGPLLATDVTAPSGDDAVLELASGSSESEAVLVTPGTSLTVSGSWQLDAYGATLELCYVGGSCTLQASIGNIGTNTVQTIGWTDFAFSVTVPDTAAEAYLKLTVAGGEVTLDTVAWETEATSEARIYVEGALSITAPALINLGSGIPGDQTEEIYDVTVVSSTVAYTLDLAATDLTNGTAGDIPATELQFREGGQSFVSPSGAGVRMTLHESQTPSAPEGTDHQITTRLVLPFTGAGTYQGTLTFYVEVE